MEKFRLTNILSAEGKNFSEGTFIILLNALSVPPHLLVSFNAKVFSITDSGRQFGSPLEKLLRFIELKKVPSFFIELKTPGDYSFEKTETTIRNSFSNYSIVIPGKISCLFPLRDFVSSLYGNEMQKANYIFELLPLLKKENAIGEVFEMNMQHEISNGEFELLTYSENEMTASITRDKKLL